MSMLFHGFPSVFHKLLMKFLCKDAHEIHKNLAITNLNDFTVFTCTIGTCVDDTYGMEFSYIVCLIRICSV